MKYEILFLAAIIGGVRLSSSGRESRGQLRAEMWQYMMSNLTLKEIVAKEREERAAAALVATAKSYRAAIGESEFAVTPSSVYPRTYCNNTANYLVDSTINTAWCALQNIQGNWIMIDAGAKPVIWRAIATQGRRGANQWVKSYKLMYTLNGTDWEMYNSGTPLEGNVDQSTIKYHLINITALKIKLMPVTWSRHISMKIEAYYQELPAAAAEYVYEQVAVRKLCNGKHNDGGYTETVKECADFCWENIHQYSKYFIFGKTSQRCRGTKCKCYCEGDGPAAECVQNNHNYYNIYKLTEEQSPDNSSIPALAVSNFHTERSSFDDSRECNTKWKLNVTAGYAWCANTNNQDQFFEIGGGPMHWVMIATQGRGKYHQYVKTYKIQYTKNGLNWLDYEQGKVFTANNDHSAIKYNSIDLNALKIRIIPLSWNNHISMRVEAYYKPVGQYQIPSFFHLLQLFTKTTIQNLLQI